MPFYFMSNSKKVFKYHTNISETGACTAKYFHVFTFVEIGLSKEQTVFKSRWMQNVKLNKCIKKYVNFVSPRY